MLLHIYSNCFLHNLMLSIKAHLDVDLKCLPLGGIVLMVNFIKAKLKYFIMISQTLPGKLKNSRAIQIKWCETELYALARSSQITCSSVLSLLAESIEFHIICECSRHPGKPGIPAFWTDVFI